MTSAIAKLQEFRRELYELLFRRRDAIMNLLDALTSEGRKCDSIVQLSNASCFQRQYSSVTDAIADGLPYAQWKQIRQLVYKQISANRNGNKDRDSESNKKPHRFIIDCTPNPRPHAKTLADRHITHMPNPAPGNKPICVGHQYSVLALVTDEAIAREKHWLIPLSAKRVESHKKGNEVGMQQIIDSIDELGLKEELTISIGDTLYGTEECRKTANGQDNLVHIFRLNSKRNLFVIPTSLQQNPSQKGRKQEFGTKMNLGDLKLHPACQHTAEVEHKGSKGKKYTVTIKCWDNMLLRGSRKFRSSQHPLNLIQITLTDEEGNAIYKKPLWLGIFGKKRHDITLIDAYQYYSSRYDIEHFFRFGKNNLLMDAYQTSDVVHEEQWWQLCMLAYTQLYLAKETSESLPEPWERYLPAYQNSESKPQVIASPSQTQRGFAKLLSTIGTPAKDCVARGRAPGRTLGEIQTKRESLPIIFKTKKIPEQVVKDIVSGCKEIDQLSNPQKIDDLVNFVQSILEKFHLTPLEFSKMLMNSS